MYDNARIILGYQSIWESRIDRKFKNNSRNHRVENLDILTFNADFSKKINEHEFRYGLDAYYNNVKSTAWTEDIFSMATSVLDTRYPDGGSM
ncbi:MAG: hypothetical protein ACOVNZ_08990, partial [Crocinitomicaceae bacterium]